MNKWVRILDGKVHEIIPEFAVPPIEWYGEEFASQCVEAPKDVCENWEYDSENGLFSPPMEETTDISEVRELVLSKVSSDGNLFIVMGIDVTLPSIGDTEHFSLHETDQINLSTALTAISQGAENYPYHADGKLCRVYPAEDILAISNAAVQHKIYHTTYCNHLLVWARRAETVEELNSIKYGCVLPDDLAHNMEEILETMGKTND